MTAFGIVVSFSLYLPSMSFADFLMTSLRGMICIEGVSD